MVYLSEFNCYSPPFKKSQDEAIAWLSETYHRAQDQQDYTAVGYAKLIRRLSGGSEHISQRSYFLPDFHSNHEKEYLLFDLEQSPLGAGALKRNEYFQSQVTQVFADLYKERSAPDDMIHVSCTGYVSPSAAQKTVNDKSWAGQTTVTHSYHMGCYGAFPALRMASGFLAAQGVLGAKKKVDIVHTELCSLHLNPQDPTPEQMVIQSLFSDGCALYAVTSEKPVGPSLQIKSLYEEQLPGTEDAMQWVCADSGMKMVLSKDVPSLVKKNLRQSFLNWTNKHGLDLQNLKNCVFAVHPGGPKIIDYVKECFELSEDQVRWSRQILKNHGNMSSATLPHIWNEILQDPAVASGTRIISLAFGPGLTVCLSLMEKTT